MSTPTVTPILHSGPSPHAPIPARIKADMRPMLAEQAVVYDADPTGGNPSKW